MRSSLLAATIALILSACSGSGPDTSPAPQLSSRNAVMSFPAFGDHKAVDWPSRKPTQYPVHGIDVSRWQDDIDWRAARASGVAFVFMKATEGGDILDPMFEQHWNGARQAGVRHGAYHFYYFCRPAEEQAAWFIENVPRDRYALPHVLDMEWNHKSPTCRLRPPGSTARAEAAKFLDILERHYGKRPIVYTTLDFYRDTEIGKLPRTQFWLRSVRDHPRVTYPGEEWTFWQYTGTGKVPGVRGPVDVNVFAGSLDQWHAWAR
ncbi:GH25 family lysozyme [Sulfitobacter sp. D35]|uniref:glycoside hydrolase family 25 protein n=1 Tax=Sulfitobacter sp. D35 TaxID=3083252 RepID=UPI00296E2DC6|nr:GH25 family lysozyme [Sulfitobacter sp. D35]MDW4497707.1 GH25 family lysozyme [Sulfitobacter sp. D35]